MNIEILKPHCAQEYRKIMLEAYELHPDAFTSSVADRSALPISWWEARLKDDPKPLEIVFGVFVDTQLAGVAGIKFESREKTRHKATLFGMYVPPHFRQHGIGKKLVNAVLAYAKKREGIKIIQLTVTSGNRGAQALYEQCGFVQFGLEPFAVEVETQFVSKVHMWCDLSKYGRLG